MKVEGRKTYKGGSKRDNCGSPTYAIMPLIEHIERYRKSQMLYKSEFVIYEPSANFSKPLNGLVEGLKNFGYPVYAPHNLDFIKVDFMEQTNNVFTTNEGAKIQMILTNPPYSVSLKRAFIMKCADIYRRFNVPWALLMLSTTYTEKIIQPYIKGCAMHVPFGRINFNMPVKGWGTAANPTQATFSTTWLSKGIAQPDTIYYDDFDVSDHFKALKRFSEMPK